MHQFYRVLQAFSCLVCGTKKIAKRPNNIIASGKLTNEKKSVSSPLVIRSHRNFFSKLPLSEPRPATGQQFYFPASDFSSLARGKSDDSLRSWRYCPRTNIKFWRESLHGRRNPRLYTGLYLPSPFPSLLRCLFTNFRLYPTSRRLRDE